MEATGPPAARTLTPGEQVRQHRILGACDGELDHRLEIGLVPIDLDETLVTDAEVVRDLVENHAPDLAA